MSSLRLVVFDFDLTLSAFHVFNSLAGFVRQGIAVLHVAAPHAQTEKGQLCRLLELEGFALAAFGGRERVLMLQYLFDALDCAGVECVCCTWGMVGPVRWCLEQVGLLKYFSEIFGVIGSTYGSKGYDLQVSESSLGPESRLLGSHINTGWNSKHDLVARCMRFRGLQSSDTVFLDDDAEEVKSMRGICTTIWVHQARGITKTELELLLSMVSRPSALHRESSRDCGERWQQAGVQNAGGASASLLPSRHSSRSAKFAGCPPANAGPSGNSRSPVELSANRSHVTRLSSGPARYTCTPATQSPAMPCVVTANSCERPVMESSSHRGLVVSLPGHCGPAASVPTSCDSSSVLQTGSNADANRRSFSISAPSFGSKSTTAPVYSSYPCAGSMPGRERRASSPRAPGSNVDSHQASYSILAPSFTSRSTTPPVPSSYPSAGSTCARERRASSPHAPGSNVDGYQASYSISAPSFTSRNTTPPVPSSNPSAGSACATERRASSPHATGSNADAHRRSYSISAPSFTPQNTTPPAPSIYLSAGSMSAREREATSPREPGSIADACRRSFSIAVPSFTQNNTTPPAPGIYPGDGSMSARERRASLPHAPGSNADAVRRSYSVTAPSITSKDTTPPAPSRYPSACSLSARERRPRSPHEPGANGCCHDQSPPAPTGDDPLAGRSTSSRVWRWKNGRVIPAPHTQDLASQRSHSPSRHGESDPLAKPDTSSTPRRPVQRTLVGQPVSAREQVNTVQGDAVVDDNAAVNRSRVIRLVGKVPASRSACTDEISKLEIELRHRWSKLGHPSVRVEMSNTDADTVQPKCSGMPGGMSAKLSHLENTAERLEDSVQGLSKIMARLSELAGTADMIKEVRAMLPSPPHQEAPSMQSIPNQQEAPSMLPVSSQQDASRILQTPSPRGGPVVPIPRQQDVRTMLPISSQQETPPMLLIATQQRTTQ